MDPVDEGSAGADCVSSMELDTFLIENIDKQGFIKVKDNISKASSLRWFTSL